ncbi:hypothetical protein POF50_017260 [Streptomyces sp. SL13]|uniref:Uncharacterized protein n=1 Tax=Streptantibioticus silvisoli TaxID=2705255 RepID=A0AA90H609_9ACTN|nr:hypothetical protein [Streptantibioticus silvisoli]MDI5971072.1 hypothetical protein [Streptantibioticus silvisoli]
MLLAELLRLGAIDELDLELHPGRFSGQAAAENRISLDSAVRPH